MKANSQKEKARLNIDQLSDVVTVQECAAVLGVTPHMVHGIIARGELKSFKFGSCRLVLKQDLKERIGFSDELERKQKNLEKPNIQDEEEEMTTRQLAKIVPTPRFNPRSYKAIELDD